MGGCGAQMTRNLKCTDCGLEFNNIGGGDLIFCDKKNQLSNKDPICPLVYKKEQVDHPKHYGGADDPYEVIKVMERWLTPDEFRGALKFNVHKYLARAGKKGATLQDQQKAAWYATYLAEWEVRNAKN